MAGSVSFAILGREASEVTEISTTTFEEVTSATMNSTYSTDNSTDGVYSTISSSTDSEIVVPVPVLGTTTDLIIFTSTICGFFILLLIFACVGWICDQVGVFGDPVAQKLRKAKFTDVKIDRFPQAHVQPRGDGGADVPGWVTHRYNTQVDGVGNSAYEEMPEPVRSQHNAAEQLDQTFHEIEDEFSDQENEYDDVGQPKPHHHQIRPSEVKARERKKSRKSQKHVYATQIQPGSSSTPASSAHHRSTNSAMYETTIGN